MESLVLFGLMCLAYFAPTMVAPKGRRGSVFVINFFLGWTVIGWVLALFMAIRAKEVPNA